MQRHPSKRNLFVPKTLRQPITKHSAKEYLNLENKKEEFPSEVKLSLWIGHLSATPSSLQKKILGFTSEGEKEINIYYSKVAQTVQNKHSFLRKALTSN